MWRIFVGLVLSATVVQATEPDAAKALAQQAITAVGGPDKLLHRFRIKEKLNVSADPKGKTTDRVSTIELPGKWWLGTTPREKLDPKILAWAWTLVVLTDPATKLATLPEITENDQPAVGLRVSGTIDPPLDLYLDKTDHQLVRIDWKSSIHRFSNWKEHDGVKYPCQVVGYRKATGKPWYFTELVELERLKELPAELKK
jgi:hypothetical protein